MTSIRSDLGRAKGLGSAKDGFKHWWALRLSSAPLAPLFFYFVSQAASIASPDRAAFISWLNNPLNAVAVLVFIICAFYHAALGMAEIIMDYVPKRAIWLALNNLVFFILAIACVYAVLALNFGH